MDADIKAFIERQKIIDVGLRYAAAIDGRDRKALRACFMPDGVWRTPQGTRTGGDEIENSRSATAALDGTQHCITNQMVTIDGDSATMRSYFIASHFKYDHPDGSNYVVGGIYNDTLKRDGNVWRFATRSLTLLWDMGNAKLVPNLGIGS